MSHNFELMTERILALRDARSWRPFHTPKDLALVLNIEAGALAELIFWKTGAEATGMAADPSKRTAIADELADVTIYALLLANPELHDAIRAERKGYRRTGAMPELPTLAEQIAEIFSDMTTNPIRQFKRTCALSH